MIDSIPRPPFGAGLPNPLQLSVANRDAAWDQIVDVVDDYFRIRSEKRVRLVEGVLVEGRIDTVPLGGATILEPHRLDSVGSANRWESTLQTIQRTATLRVVPLETGYLIDVAVHKELEDLPRPERATTGPATLRHDDTPQDRRQYARIRRGDRQWIPVGRDVALEQTILAQIVARAGAFAGAGY